MRIFVLGDSFADNLFEEAYNDIIDYNTINPNIDLSQISKYLISLQNENIENAKWWTDWLEEWGYEIINLGKGSCSNQNIFYQFAKIDKEFREGDRIILHWTDHCRFDWMVNESGWNTPIHPNIAHSYFDCFDSSQKGFLNNQSVFIDNSFTKKSGYLNNHLIPFMDLIVEKHSEYNPIVWSVFNATMKHLNKSRYFDIQSPRLLGSLKDKWEIRKESGDLFDDGHFGRYGNYYTAVVFNEIIKSGITINFTEERNSKLIIQNTINRIKDENLIFKNPLNWPEYFEKNIILEVKKPNNFSKWITEKHKSWF
jgi:hypothetical protein